MPRLREYGNSLLVKTLYFCSFGWLCWYKNPKAFPKFGIQFLC